MKLASDGKINEDGIISSNEMITEKEGYEAMLYMLKAYWEATESNDLTDVLSGGKFWPGMRQGMIVSVLNHLAHRAVQGPGDPPWDLDGGGKLSLREANIWYREGRGQAITVDASSVDLDFLNPSTFSLNEKRVVQSLFWSKDGRVYGDLTVKYKGQNMFGIYQDNYGFEMHDGYGFKTFIRNRATRIGSYFAGEGQSYNIKFEGVNRVHYRAFKPKFVSGYKW